MPRENARTYEECTGCFLFFFANNLNVYFSQSIIAIKGAKHAYQAMLKFDGCLFTLFFIGSISVRLNTLIRHLFIDL